ncbi:glutathione synthetase-like isoform X2 [Leptotrombidium deliense]|uniref:Glutathione synthetase n=1 Tax=Leptotrombidium deliense TaxID=299467 RepID=A0A443SLY2_9ACAR|nr:glutathione synthetase-like isoform X2 [Leptotrombidium deliense]
MENCLPLLSDDLLRVIVSDVKNYALSNGLGLRCKESPNDDMMQLLPISLFPSPFPRATFEFAQSIQKSVNKLMHAVSLDSSFLCEQLETTIAVDEFTKNLLLTHLKVLKEGSAQENSLGLFRADYMLNEEPQLLRQIEVNAISVSFGGLSNKVSKIHEYVMSKYNPAMHKKESFPQRDTCFMLAKGLTDAWDYYGVASAVILIVVEDTVINVYDQKAIEFAVYHTRPEIKIMRKKFSELPSITRLVGNQLLFVENNEVAVVYFRTAYTPEQYNQSLWDLRFLLEKSKAIICPSIHYQLAGVKKIQQVLTKKEVLEKFLTESNEMEAVYSTFAKISGLELNEQGNAALAEALNHPHKYVLKPQREGGGNNFYGEEMVGILSSLKNDRKREAFIVMELISPRPIKNYILRPSYPVSSEPEEIVGELGIFGTIMGNKNEILFNEETGYVLRSKAVGVKEGGISAGFGILDTPFLY